MAIRVTCEKCNKTINAPDHYAGKTAKCPSCSAPLLIPAVTESGPAPVVDKSASNSLAPPPGAPPEPSKPSRDVFTVVAPWAGIACPVLAVLALLMGIGGSSDLALLFAGLCLPLSLTCISVFARLVQQRERAQDAQRDAENHAVECDTRYNTYKRDFDQIVSAAREDVNAEHQRRMSLLDTRERDIEERENREKTVQRLGKRLLDDTVKNISHRLTASNFTASRDRLTKAIDFCRKHEFAVSPGDEKDLLANLREEFEAAVRKQHDKEEQARIKARIREEQKAEKEIERELARVDAERKAVEAALEAALKDAADEHSAEVDALRAKLADAEERAQRAMSMAQQTRAGHVYVISNIGSFGENVYKIGMTRRLEPLDRVKELGDASVPFPFDVHMMISCDDAPALESRLHREFNDRRLNKVNLRKEFFNVDLERIREVVEANHGEVSYQATPDAFEYRESREMTQDDFAMVAALEESLGGGDDYED